MDINSLFPSPYLKSADFQNQTRRVIIESCTAESISDGETKPGPPYVKVGHAIRYLVADLDAWLQEHRVVPQRAA